MIGRKGGRDHTKNQGRKRHLSSGGLKKKVRGPSVEGGSLIFGTTIKNLRNSGGTSEGKEGGKKTEDEKGGTSPGEWRA